MKNKLKRTLCLLLVVLCMTSFSVTAFAYADDSAATTPTTEAATTDTESTEADTQTDAEIPYTYTISDTGEIVITINGQEWVYGDESEDDGTTPGRVVTNGGRLNLRTGAGMSYEIIDQLRNGEEVTVIGTEGDWYKVIVPEKTGYVHSDYLELLEKAEENSEIDSAMLMLIMNMMFQSMNTEDTESTDESLAFTPPGNLSLIDDFLQIEVPGTEDTEQVEKQFITVQSKSGNTFYIVIDRNGETENVYFLNLVDEADLMALIEGEDGAAAPTCSCTEKCAVGAINTNCEICRSNMSECVGKEPVVEPEPTEPTEEPAEEKEGMNPLPIVILIVALGAGGAVYWFKFKNKKPKTSGSSDLDDYDYGQDDDDYEEETEYDDADLMAEADDTDDSDNT